MARKDNYRGMVLHCVVCQEPISPERKWDAITCSPECSKIRKDYGRSRKDQSHCRYCLHPSTPEERARYMTWRKWEKAGTTEAESSASLLREIQRLKKKLTDETK